MNYEESLAYIHSAVRIHSCPGLGRIAGLCEKLGNPQDEMRFIHVAGTNGKGSFCAMTDSILRAAGYRTGLYTSPFIRRFNERMAVDGEPISDGKLAELTTLVRGYADGMEDKPCEFELITAIAFEYFRRHRCDVVVLEVGLGGRLDATNVIKNPLLSVITGIDFDHTKLLGNTIQKIAAEKAGIIKEGYPCLYGGTDSSACRTISSIAELRRAPFHTVDRSRLSVKKYALDGTAFDFAPYRDLRLSLLGSYQPENAASVLTAIELLNENGFSVSGDAVKKGLADVTWPARFELIWNDPVILCDGGHNPQGIRAAVKSIRTYFPEQKVHILTGVMADKAYDEMVETLKPVTARAYTVTPDNPRALPAGEYAALFREHKIPADAYDDLFTAACAAVEDSRREGIPLVCLGSLYLYKDASEALLRAAKTI